MPGLAAVSYPSAIENSEHQHEVSFWNISHVLVNTEKHTDYAH